MFAFVYVSTCLRVYVSAFLRICVPVCVHLDVLVCHTNTSMLLMIHSLLFFGLHVCESVCKGTLRVAHADR